MTRWFGFKQHLLELKVQFAAEQPLPTEHPSMLPSQFKSHLPPPIRQLNGQEADLGQFSKAFGLCNSAYGDFRLEENTHMNSFSLMPAPWMNDYFTVGSPIQGSRVLLCSPDSTLVQFSLCRMAYKENNPYKIDEKKFTVLCGTAKNITEQIQNSLN